jgi:hypothetical protein
MWKALSPSATQCGLVCALFAALLWGLLAPGGNGQVLALAASAAVGTPGIGSTPIPPRPVPPAAAPSGPAAPAPLATPEATPLAAGGGRQVATPQAATPTSATRPASAGTPGARFTPTATPTRVPSGDVSATVVREMSPLSFTLNGRDQVATTTMVIAVNDTAPLSRQPGWRLSLRMDQFAVAGSTTRALPLDAVTLEWTSVACVAGAECSEFGNAVAFPFTMPAGQGVPFYVAAAGSGHGQYLLTLTFAVRVPGNAYAGNYTTNIAVDITR